MLNNQFSSSQINETLLNAMKTIAQKEVQNLEFDVTEKCTIVRKDKDKNKEECYIVRCNGAEWEAYETNGVEYYKNDIVLVNIPKNKWTEKKYIVGLADTQTTTHFFPSSNFVPMRTEIPRSYAFKENTAIISLSKTIDKTLSSIFNYSNSIYLKCDFKYNGNKLTYNYGLKIILSYGNKLTPKELIFSSDLFTGNPTLPYFFTQDILFENIEDENLNSVESIIVQPYCSGNYSDMEKEVKIRNLELKIGHLLDSNTGLKIVTDNIGLKYNDDSEGQLSYSTATLGLIWYNTDEEGNYIGFNNGMEIVSAYNITESVTKDKIDYSQISVDEYEYTERKNRFDQIYSLYETGLCPYDTVGLQMADDVLIAEKQLQQLFSKILTLNTDFKSFIDEYSKAFYRAFNYLTPERYVKRTDDIGNIEDDYELSLLNEHRTNLGETFNLILLEFDELIQANTTFKNELEEGYNHWRDFFATVLTNVRLMQDLEFKIPQTGEDSNTINLIPLQLTEPKYLPIVSQNQNLNFQDIINDAENNLKTFKLSIETQIPRLIQILTEKIVDGDKKKTSLTDYYIQCLRSYCRKKGYDPDKESTFKDDEDITKFRTEFTELMTPLKISSNNKDIDSIWDTYDTDTFSVNLDSIIKFIDADIRDYKNSNKIALQDCEFWKNSNFIYTASYNKTEPYYNLYYSKYADFLEQVEKDNWELTDKTNISLVEEDLIFDPVFENYIKEEEKKKFALYWYKEDLLNLEKDILLGEDCWSLIDQCRDTSVSSCGFPNFWENPATQKEAAASNKIYHLQSCTPFDEKSIITVPLDLNKKTTTFKVVLYYDHVLQGTAEITFNNVQYQSIGTENSLMDIEYKNDVYTLAPHAKSTLDLSILCYDSEDGRKLNEKVQWGASSNYPKLIGKWLMTSNDFSRKAAVKSFSANKGNMTYTLTSYPSNTKTFGVIRLQYQISEDESTDSYFPLAWSSQRSLSLEGPKILSILNDDGEYSWDSYNGTNKKSPKAYKLLGANDIKNVNYQIMVYDRAGTIIEDTTKTYIDVYGNEQVVNTIPIRVKEIENTISTQTTSGKEYTLEFDYNMIEEFMEIYEPVLVVTGESEQGAFQYYQSIFIFHYNFDYDKDTFKPLEGTLDSSLLVKDDMLIFFDDREKDLFNYLVRNGTRIGQLAAILASKNDISMNDYMAIRGALGTIIDTKKYSKAFQFYFDKQRDTYNVLPLINTSEDKDYENSDWKHIYEDVNASTHPSILTKKVKVYLQVPNIATTKIEKHDQTYRQQLERLFDDLHAIAIDYQTTNEKWQSRTPIEISFVTQLLKDINWDAILNIYGTNNEKKE